MSARERPISATLFCNTMSALQSAPAKEINEMKQKITELTEQYHNETNFSKKQILRLRIDCHLDVLKDWGDAI